jgi:hypothetical protein
MKVKTRPPIRSLKGPTVARSALTKTIKPAFLAPTFLSEVRYILALFLASRLALVLIGLMAHSLSETGYGKQFSWSKYTWLDMWGVWDAYWYMDIAQNGYSTTGSIAGHLDQTNFSFFPLYPLLMRFFGGLMGGEYFVAGLLISNVCLLLACYLLYKLVEMEQSRAIARRAVKYLFLFPVSFILSGLFTESLYLCLMLLCFYWAKRRRWWLAGAAGALLSATRILGVLIALPLGFEYLRSLNFNWRKIRLESLFLLLIPMGLLGFGLYSYRVTGDFFYFKTNQAAWGRELLNPLVMLWQGLVQGLAQASARKLLEVGFAIAALWILCIGYRKIGFAYWVLGMYSLLIPLAAGIDSMARFTLPIFPIFIILATWSRYKIWDDALTFFLICIQGCLMMYWCTGQALVV